MLGEEVGRGWEVRGDEIRDWEEVIAARPYTGTRVLEVGLVDRPGTLDNAIDLARQMAGLLAAEWVRPPTPELLDLLLGGADPRAALDVVAPSGLERLVVGPNHFTTVGNG